MQFLTRAGDTRRPSSIVRPASTIYFTDKDTSNHRRGNCPASVLPFLVGEHLARYEYCALENDAAILQALAHRKFRTDSRWFDWRIDRGSKLECRQPGQAAVARMVTFRPCAA
jgi:hypothetical protein